MPRLVTLLLVASSLAQAQLVFPEGELFARNPIPKQGVIADVTATLTAQTPWGEIKQVETGKYWRSGKGRIRQDDEHGLSIVLDPHKSIATIDSTANLVLQRFVANSNRHLYSFWGDLVLDSGTLDGAKVVKGSGETERMRTEVWISPELQMVLLLRYETATTVFEQRYYNLRFEEPPEATFAIPKGMRIVTAKDAFTPQARCYAIRYGISGTDLRGRYSMQEGCK